MANTMKKLLSLTIALIMVLSLIPAVSAETVQVTDSMSYTTNEAGWVELNSLQDFNKWFRTSTTADGILEAASNAGVSVTAKLILKEDITLNVGAFVGETSSSPAHNIILDLNGHTITYGLVSSRRDEQLFMVNNSTLVLMNGSLRGTGATDDIEIAGGMIHVSNGNLKLINMDIQREQTEDKTSMLGGILYAHRSNVLIDGCTFTGATGKVNQGGICYATGIKTDPSAINIVNSSFTGGSASAQGGAFYISYAHVNLINSTVTGGTAGTDGGNFYCQTAGNGDAGVHAYASTISNGTAGNCGGNISIRAGYFKLYDCKLQEGTASSIGASIHMQNITSAKVYLYNTEVSHQTATTVCSQSSKTCALLNRGTSGVLKVHHGSFKGAAITGLGSLADNACGTVSQQDGVITVAEPEATQGTIVPVGCASAGYTPFTCNTCSIEYCGNVVVPTGHSEQAVPGKAATCTEKGYTEGKVCANCNVDLKGQIATAKVAHDMEYQDAVAATCEDTGLTAGQYCKNCDTQTVKQEVVPATGHDIVIEEAKAPTCEDTGLTTGQYCKNCDTQTVKQEEIPATGHAWDEGTVTTEPGCEAAGVKTFTCQNDATHTKTEPVDATGHDMVYLEAKAATCEDTGLTAGQYCKNCDTQTVKQEEIPATGHKWDDGVYTAPTFEADGFTTYTCTVENCGTPKVVTDEGSKLTAVAKVEEELFQTLQAAIEAAEGKTVVLLADAELAEVRADIDLNGFTLKADVYGKLTVNGGTLITPQGYEMVGPNAAFYKSEDAVLTMAGPTGDITVHTGTMTLAQSWWTGKGQTITIEKDATFVIPQGMTLNILSTVIADGTLTVNGEANLYDAAATITAAEGLNVVTTVEAGAVMYAEGVYTVVTDTMIVEHPQDVETNLGETVTFSVKAAGKDLVYLWLYKKTGTNKWYYWTNPEADNAAITVEATLARDGYQFKCVVMDVEGVSVVSEVATLTIKAQKQIEINTQPVDTKATTGKETTISVDATVAGTATYLWQYQRPGTNAWYYWAAPGAEAAITITPKMQLNGYKFRCVISNDNGAVEITREVTLTVTTALSGATLGAEEAEGVVTLTATTNGAAETYLWLYQRPDMAEANLWYYWAAPGAESQITVEAAKRAGYTFKCVVFDANGGKATTNLYTVN